MNSKLRKGKNEITSENIKLKTRTTANLNSKLKYNWLERKVSL